MNFNHLRTFVAVADAKSISGAADQLGTTQPVVSRIVRLLEDAWGVELFDRLPRGVELTQFGVTYYQHSVNILNEYRLARDEVSAQQGGSWGFVRVGAGMNWLEHGLPQAVGDFLLQNPNYKIEVKHTNRDSIVSALIDCDVDVGLSPFDPNVDTLQDIDYEELFVDKYVVIGRKDHPLRELLETETDKIADLDWALTNTMYAETRLESLFAKFEIKPPAIRFRCHAMRNILEVVCDTDLVTFAPEYCLADTRADQLAQLAPEMALSRSKGILLPSQRQLTPAARSFVDHVRTTFGKNAK